MLNSQQVRRIKGVLVVVLLAGGGYFGVNYNEYFKAKKAEYRWKNAADGTILVYHPLNNDKFVMLGDNFIPGSKAWKPEFNLPPRGQWNGFFIDRLLKIPDPAAIFPEARLEEMKSQLSGLLQAAILDPPDRLSPPAMKAIVQRGQRGDAEASACLENLLRAPTPRVRMLAIKGLAGSRTPPVRFDTDAEYESWFQGVVVPQAFKVKETAR